MNELACFSEATLLAIIAVSAFGGFIVGAVYCLYIFKGGS